MCGEFVMIRKLPKNKFVIHCKEVKYYNVDIEADSYEEAEKKWKSIAKRRDYTTLHNEFEVLNISEE